MLRKKKLLSFIMSVVLVLGLVFSPSMSFAQEESLSLTIIHINDVHANVDDVEDSNIGYARLKSIVDSLKAEDPNLILLDAGDTFHGTNFANFTKGETIVNLMNKVGFDAMTPGNHDFNYGSERLLELAELADFPILGANVVSEGTGQGLLEDYTILTMENGLEVGIFGLSTQETKLKSHPNNTIGVDFEDPIAKAQEMVDELEDLGVDFIIALSHIGLDEESDPTSEDIAEAVEGIDLLVDGHSHSTLENGKLVDGTLIVQASSHMANIGLVEIEIDGLEMTKKARLISYAEAQVYDEDSEILNYIKEINDENDEILSQVIGESKVYLDGVRENVRAGETNLGNLITDAMRDLAGVDLALTNGGGIRASIEAGDITMNDVLTVLPFANYPVVIEVSGQDIVEALEFGTQSYPEPAGGFPHVSGMSYEINTLGPEGERIENVLIAGKPIDLEAKYNLITNDFMAAGGDGYVMFEDAPIVVGFDHLLLSDVLIEYIQSLDEVNPQIEGRIKEAEKNAINKNPKLKYIEGYDDNTVRPGKYMTREEVTSVFYRLLTDSVKNKVKNSQHKFTDVASSRWSNQAIATLANLNVLSGYDDGTFRPGAYITRAEAVKITSLFDTLNQVDENDFVDLNGHWAINYINSAADKGWIKGYPDKTFRPDQEMTRAEFVSLVNRMLDREADSYELTDDASTFSDLNESAWYYKDMMAAINGI